jgi:hypothetical protein
MSLITEHSTAVFTDDIHCVSSKYQREFKEYVPKENILFEPRELAVIPTTPIRRKAKQRRRI